MTVTTDINRWEYDGNGSTTVFPYTGKIFAAADLQVYLVTSEGVELEQTLNTNYTVSGVGAQSGGNVTFLEAPDSGVTVSIRRVLEIVQDTGIKNQGAYYPEIHEDQFDRCIMIDQQQQDQIDRSLQRPEVSGDAYDADSRKIINVADPENDGDVATRGYVDNLVGTIVSTGGSTTPLKFEFAGDGVTTDFECPGISVSSPDAYMVTIDGVLQNPGDDYGVDLTADEIEFVVAPPSGTSVVIRIFGFARIVDDAATLRADLASSTEGKGADLVGVHDSSGNFESDTVEGALSELVLKTGSSGASAAWPTITDDGFTFNDECDDLSLWTEEISTGAFVRGSAIVVPDAGGVGNEIRLTRETTVFSDNDYVLYFSMRTGVETGNYAGIRLADAANAFVFAFTCGYNYVTPGAEVGTVSCQTSATAQPTVLLTDFDYGTDFLEIAIHVDRKYDKISIYMKADGNWFYLASLDYYANFANITKVQLQAASPAAPTYYDYFSIGRPALMVIGDSIAAGSRGFNPDPDVWVGTDNYNSTWQRHAPVYPNIRNSLIVNKGVGGDTSATILARVTDVTNAAPQVVFLHASSNDEHNGLTPEQRTTNIQDTINAIVSAGAEVILLNAIYANSNNAHYPDQGDYMREWWQNSLGSVVGQALNIDIMQPVVGADGYIDPAYTDADGIHPEIIGYRLIGRYIKSFEPCAR